MNDENLRDAGADAVAAVMRDPPRPASLLDDLRRDENARAEKRREEYATLICEAARAGGQLDAAKRKKLEAAAVALGRSVSVIGHDLAAAQEYLTLENAEADHAADQAAAAKAADAAREFAAETERIVAARRAEFGALDRAATAARAQADRSGARRDRRRQLAAERHELLVHLDGTIEDPARVARRRHLIHGVAQHGSAVPGATYPIIAVESVWSVAATDQPLDFEFIPLPNQTQEQLDEVLKLSRDAIDFARRRGGKGPVYGYLVRSEADAGGPTQFAGTVYTPTAAAAETPYSIRFAPFPGRDRAEFEEIKAEVVKAWRKRVKPMNASTVKLELERREHVAAAAAAWGDPLPENFFPVIEQERWG